ncbi:zinc transporter ZntB [Pseudooceanicola sp. LIPI14-2-Ac024]|uniref:zinc transporter ZntB n=1 Tax=Pseudooceanicola sp. LIPI14-2-Ac024 TaxID=3344875 RepID=UPI0035CEA7D9
MTGCIRFSFALDGPEAGRDLTEPRAVEVLREATLGWVHLDADHPDSPDWIARNLSYLDPAAREALTMTATRARATRIGDGVLVILRGVNTNEGRDPEDMVSVRVWADAQRIVTLSRQKVRAIGEIAAAIREGRGPSDAGGFLVALARHLNAGLEPLVAALDTETDALELEVIGNPDRAMRQRIVAMRLQVIELYRHSAPQVAALRDLEASGVPILSEADLRHVSEIRQSLTRQTENLVEVRESLAVLREELSSHVSDRLNRHMYVLSILSAVFLPLGFLTGLFGINLAGMPGADDPFAFWVFTGLLGVVFALQVLVVRWMRWM